MTQAEEKVTLVTCEKCGALQAERTCCGRCGHALGFASAEEKVERCGGSGRIVMSAMPGNRPDDVACPGCPDCAPAPPDAEEDDWRNDEEAQALIDAINDTGDAPDAEGEQRWTMMLCAACGHLDATGHACPEMDGLTSANGIEVIPASERDQLRRELEQVQSNLDGCSAALKEAAALTTLLGDRTEALQAALEDLADMHITQYDTVPTDFLRGIKKRACEALANSREKPSDG